jgi:hypothetical protein
LEGLNVRYFPFRELTPKSAGFQAHVTKPMDPNVLVATIVDVIHSTPAIEAA